MDSVGEGEGGKIWENGIETCKICTKQGKKKKKEESSDRQQKAILRSMSDIDLIKFNDFLNYQKLEYIRSLCFCDLMKHTKIWLYSMLGKNNLEEITCKKDRHEQYPAYHNEKLRSSVWITVWMIPSSASFEGSNTTSEGLDKLN